MRVLFLEDTPTTTMGGQEFSMFDQCAGLVARGYEVTLGYTHAGNLLDGYRANGVRTVRLGPYAIDRARPIGTGARFLRAVSRGTLARADVVGVNGFYMTLAGAAIARLTRAPMVCHLRLFPPPELCGQWSVGMPTVTRYIAVSHAVKRAWVDRGVDPEIVDVVHDGIDTERFRPYDNRLEVRRALGVPDDAFMLAYAGRIDRTKNIEAMLRTFAMLELPPSLARLVIAGRPVDHATPEAAQAYLAELRALAASLKITDSVHWLGPRSDVPEIFSAADVTGLFSLLPEPLARATYESLACGTPAIAWNDGGMGEVLSGELSRFAFDGNRPHEVVSLLRSLLNWRQREPELGSQVRAHALARFSKDAMTDGIARSLERASRDPVRRRGPAAEHFRRHVPSRYSAVPQAMAPAGGSDGAR